MKTKFIGLEGFNEIESLSTTKKRAVKKDSANTTFKKTIRFSKRLFAEIKKQTVKLVAEISESKPAKNSVKKSAAKTKKATLTIDKCYRDNRATSSEYTNSVKDAINGISFKNNKRKYAHSAPVQTRTRSILRKKAVLAVVACSVAIMCSCITVANALDFKPSNTNVVATTKQFVAVEPQTENNNNFTEEIANSFVPATADEAIAFNNDAYVSVTKALVDDNMQTACVGLYIDGKLIGATSEVDALKNALAKVLVDYRADYDEQTTTEFANNVVVKSGNFSNEDIMSVDDILNNANSKFSISLSTDIIYTKEIKFDTKVKYDESKSSSYKKVTTKGVNGEEKVTVRTTYIDGVQSQAVQTDSKVLKKAVTEVVVKGSQEDYSSSSSSSYSSSSTSASGSFIWPVPYTHNITSPYAWRWGTMHWGIDIAAGGVYGQAIVASDSGTVIQAGDNNDGYGNYVIIDHGNGYKTLYGHCSSLAVSYGQTVSQGQTIAYVGSTGYSTGPHLHFEVIQNGSKLNPSQFVS